ncbi:hypothetical protein [Neptuniibacter sp. QD37_11]|uniref:hypothetical protein n=1 Tax=Neptuniibacter sp. QD37_11 TaxID=3398209 RepID=UPI0039F49D61
MLVCFVWLLIATIGIQVPNLLGIQSQTENTLSAWAAFKITLLTLPVTLLATTGFTLFYGRGSQFFSYPAMAVYAKVAALIAAIIIQVWVFKNRDTNWLEMVGLSLCLFGFIVSIYSKDLLKLLH